LKESCTAEAFTCNDDAPGSGDLTSALVEDLRGGQEILIVVQGFAGDPGFNPRVDITIGPA
jgi:hypothetical protein